MDINPGVNMEQIETLNNQIELERLREIEESLMKALHEAMNDKPPATPVVIEDLQTRYYLAKQEREDFENTLL